jgi:hypothetical protein
MQARGRGAAKPPIGIAFECDLGNDIDSTLTLAMLQGLAGGGKSRLIALSVSSSNLKAAQYADIVNGFYAGRAFGGSAPLGFAAEGKNATDTPLLNAILSKKNADGTPAYVPSIKRMLDTADGAVLIRNMLLAQNDENAIVLFTGPATGIARLMDLYGAMPQIAQKVKTLVVAAGTFPSGAPDAGLKADPAAAKKVFQDWPTPIVAVGSEVGEALPYPGSSIEADFSWSPAHPVADAYRAFKPMPYDAAAPGLAAALYAAQSEDGFFKLSEPGTISVSDDGRTKFTPGAAGKHRYLIVDPTQKDRITKAYTDLIAAKPAPRPGRGGRGVIPPPQQQVPPPKPAEVKPPPTP